MVLRIALFLILAVNAAALPEPLIRQLAIDSDGDGVASTLTEYDLWRFDGQTSGTVYAGPTSGGPEIPAFRHLALSDLPPIELGDLDGVSLGAPTTLTFLRWGGEEWTTGGLSSADLSDFGGGATTGDVLVRSGGEWMPQELPLGSIERGGATSFNVLAWDTDSWSAIDPMDALSDSGYTVWHEANDGSGSGLAADTLDNYEASAFPRKAEDATVTGSWTFSNIPSAPSVRSTTGNFALQPTSGARLAYFTPGVAYFEDIRSDGLTGDSSLGSDEDRWQLWSDDLRLGGTVLSSTSFDINTPLALDSTETIVFDSATSWGGDDSIISIQDNGTSAWTLGIAGPAEVDVVHEGNYSVSGSMDAGRVTAVDGDFSTSVVADSFVRGGTNGFTGLRDSMVQVGEAETGFYTYYGNTLTAEIDDTEVWNANPTLLTTLVNTYIGSDTTVGEHRVRGRLEIDGSTTIGHELLLLDQNDTDQPFIEFQGLSGTGPESIRTNGVGAISGAVAGPASNMWMHAGMLKISVNGSAGYVPYYTAP